MGMFNVMYNVSTAIGFKLSLGSGNIWRVLKTLTNGEPNATKYFCLFISSEKFIFRHSNEIFS